MPKIYVQAENAARIYQQGPTNITALKTATCTVKTGDRIALLGPSGSGKSTLLHLFAGLDRPTSGKVTWPELGEIADLRPDQISLIFQMPSLLAPLSVLENVILPQLMKGIPEAEARLTALDLLEQMGLDSILEKLPEELSGGQAQRVAAARALASRPRLILADEPTGQLDRKTGQQLLDVCLENLKGTDTALVIATHDMDVARRMLTVWRMEHGELEVDNQCCQKFG